MYTCVIVCVCVYVRVVVGWSKNRDPQMEFFFGDTRDRVVLVVMNKMVLTFLTYDT